tara:strand:- start:473 stop:1072 length:600 start_codon:yes stop_codon:yes gene_type:complete
MQSLELLESTLQGMERTHYKMMQEIEQMFATLFEVGAMDVVFMYEHNDKIFATNIQLEFENHKKLVMGQLYANDYPNSRFMDVAGEPRLDRDVQAKTLVYSNESYFRGALIYRYAPNRLMCMGANLDPDRWEIIAERCSRVNAAAAREDIKDEPLKHMSSILSLCVSVLARQGLLDFEDSKAIVAELGDSMTEEWDDEL